MDTVKKKISATLVSLILFLGIPVIAVTCFFVYKTYDAFVSAGTGAEAQKELEIEFTRITPMPHAVVLRQNSSNKSRQATVGAEYRIRSSFSEIRAYYHSELLKKGWTFLREENVIHNDRDHGGKHLFYCKGRYTANVQYAGAEESEFGWTYFFGLSWGIFDKC